MNEGMMGSGIGTILLLEIGLKLTDELNGDIHMSQVRTEIIQRGGGVVNQDVVLINVLAEIQRNLNAFAILAENKRVDIAIADNPLKFVQIFCLIFSNIFCLINLI
jgi:hypothetical protein